MTDTVENWTTFNSHPFSGLAYQEMFGENGTVARLVQDGREIVSPSSDLNLVYRQYMSRVANYSD